MDKMIISVFDDERQAYEGSRAIQELHREGSITLYAGAIVARDADGAIHIKEAADEGPVGTAVGMLAGSLVGILGGPVGVVAGAAAGGLIGSIRDLSVAGVDAEFLDDVSSQLQPGKVAVVVEAAEHWTTPLDARIEALGGVVLRRSRTDVVDAQIEREVQATKDDLVQLRAELKGAREEAAAKIQSRLERDKAKLEQLAKRAEAEVDRLESESRAKVETLQNQIKTASEESKAKCDERRTALAADYKRRTDKLKEAGRLARQALSA
jgi:uncharacterized membrane protein